MGREMAENVEKSEIAAPVEEEPKVSEAVQEVELAEKKEPIPSEKKDPIPSDDEKNVAMPAEKNDNDPAETKELLPVKRTSA